MSQGTIVIPTASGWRFDRGGRRRYVYRNKDRLSSVSIRAMMARGMDTLDIARKFKTTEAAVWNALARAGA